MNDNKFGDHQDHRKFVPLPPAGRSAKRNASVIAVRQTVDTEAGEVLDEPFILAQNGEMPGGIVQD